MEHHHKMRDICSIAPQTRLTCHQVIYGGIRWDQLVRLAISTTETLSDLKTDLVVANNTNMKANNLINNFTPSCIYLQITSLSCIVIVSLYLMQIDQLLGEVVYPCCI